jgi:diguanylate cyclase (GGDEF)-like protein
VDASDRVRRARTICVAVMGLAMVASAPWNGWWTLGLLAAAGLSFARVESRMRRAERPEWVAASTQIFVMLLIAAGIALSGGQDSPVLSWIVIPGALGATRFRWQVVAAAGAATTLVLLAVTIPVDPGGVAADPARLIGAVALVISILAITSALTRGEQIQRDRAVLDPLTGLLNRAALDFRATELEQQARLSGGVVSIVVCDVDRFKRVNDSHGHDRGDAVLRDVAYEIRKSLRSFELVYRIGGEEFLVLLPGIHLSEAAEIAERVRRSVMTARPGELAMTISAGVASTAGDSLGYEELFRRADAALLQAKREGRNRVVAAGDLPAVPIPDARRLQPAVDPAQAG